MASGDKYNAGGESSGTIDPLDLFPVGSIITSYVSTNPSNYIGGTWTQIAGGRLLVGVGTGTDTNDTTKTFSVGNNSGEEYEHTQTISNMYPHYHRMMSYTGSSVNGSSSYSSSADRVTYNADGKSYITYTYYRGGAGNGLNKNINSDEIYGDSAMNVCQPSYGVYIWRRTE